MKNLAHILLASLVLASCGKTEKGKEIIREVQVPVQAPASTSENQGQIGQTIEKEEAFFKLERSVEINDDLSNYKEFVAGLNKFQITAELKNFRGYSARLVCRELNPVKEKEDLKAYIDKDSSKVKIVFSLDTDAPNVTEYNCKIISGDKEVISENKFEVKKDYYIESGVKGAKSVGLIDGTNHIGALVINEGASLVTEGMRMHIKANEFIAMYDSTIQSYLETDLNSPDNTVGKSGGLINIHSTKSFGKLTVFMRGKTAGTNTNLDDSYEKLTLASLECPKEYKETERIVTTILDKNPKYMNAPKSTKHHLFEIKGGKGLDGGDSGSFNIFSQKSSLALDVIKQPGKGGRGGLTTNPADSITVEMVKPQKHPFWTKENRNNRQFLDWFFKTSTFSESCQALVRMNKVPSLINPTVGPDGESGVKDDSCITVKDTNESYCF